MSLGTDYERGLNVVSKTQKRGGFGWHHEKMQEAGRVERLWLAMAVAMVWMVSLGTQAESQLPTACPENLPERHIARKRIEQASPHAPVRRLSCAQRGRLVLLAALIQSDVLPIGRLLASKMAWDDRIP
jgi:hypothetical protein